MDGLDKDALDEYQKIHGSIPETAEAVFIMKCAKLSFDFHQKSREYFKEFVGDKGIQDKHIICLKSSLSAHVLSLMENIFKDKVLLELEMMVAVYKMHKNKGT